MSHGNQHLIHLNKLLIQQHKACINNLTKLTGNQSILQIISRLKLKIFNITIRIKINLIPIILIKFKTQTSILLRIQIVNKIKI